VMGDDNQKVAPATDENVTGGAAKSETRFEDIVAANDEMNPVQLTDAEDKRMKYLKAFGEIACVGAGLGGNVENVTEVHVMKCCETMKSPVAAKKRRATKEEYQRIVENGVWTTVPESEVSNQEKLRTSTWTMMNKSNVMERVDCDDGGRSE
jgi:hypothetical protein